MEVKELISRKEFAERGIKEILDDFEKEVELAISRVTISPNDNSAEIELILYSDN